MMIEASQRYSPRHDVMKALNISLLLLFFTVRFSVLGQITFTYDQQSAVEGQYGEGGGVITTSQPLGQSFTPMLDSVGFVRFKMRDIFPGNGIGSVVHVNLRTISITGPILATSDSTILPDRFGYDLPEYPNFVFTSAVSVTSGTIYFLQPVLQSGDTLIVADTPLIYVGGNAFIKGSDSAMADLWFREGIVVPEPAAGWLIAVGGAAAVIRRLHRHRRAQRSRGH